MQFRTIAQVASISFLSIIGVSSALPPGTNRAYGLLTTTEKSRILASDNPTAPLCYDFQQVNCTAVRNDGTLSNCGSSYYGPCTGTCTNACSLSSGMTWTSQVGTNLAAQPTFTASGANTCGFVLTDGSCTSIPNGGTVKGAGCYCLGSKTDTTQPCQNINDGVTLPNPPACAGAGS